jgi:hypothetical protein
LPRTRIFVLLACLLVPVALAGRLTLLAQAPEQQQAGPTEKTDYEFYGPQDPIDPEENRAELGRLRESLWAHWTQRRGGEFHAVAYTYDGDQSTLTFSFGNTSDSHCFVHVISVYDEAYDPESGRHGEERRHTEEYYFDVKRIDLKSGRTIPDSEKRDGTTYKLLFIDKANHVKWKY